MTTRWNTAATRAVLIATPTMVACGVAGLQWLALAMALVVILNAQRLHIATPWRDEALASRRL